MNRMTKINTGESLHVVEYDFNAHCMFEELTGNSIIAWQREVQKQAALGDDADISFVSLRNVLYVGLNSVKGGDDYSMSEAGEVMQEAIDNERLEDMIGELAEAIAKSFPEAKGEEKKGPEGETDDSTTTDS